MDTIQIDYLTVLIAAVLNMIIGYFWYSNWLFGPTWMKLNKIKKMESSGFNILYDFIVSLVIVYFLAFFEVILGITTVTDGMFVGFTFWLGFVVTTQINPVIWGKQPFRLFLLDTGYKLLSFLVMSGVIGA